MVEKYMIFYYDGFKIKAPGYQKIYAKEERKNGKSYDVGARKGKAGAGALDEAHTGSAGRTE